MRVRDLPLPYQMYFQTARHQAADIQGDLSVCTDRCSTDNVTNRIGARLRLMAPLGTVKPPTFTES